MMYFTILTDVLDQLRMLTTVSPYYLLDYFFSWIPFYHDLKLFIILYSSIKLEKIFKKPTSNTEIDINKWTDKWIKNYVKWNCSSNESVKSSIKVNSNYFDLKNKLFEQLEEIGKVVEDYERQLE